MGSKKDLWFFSAFCSSCKTKSLVAVIVKDMKPPKLVTDLAEEELSGFAEREEVTADEVIDMHNFLKSYNGDFSDLFTCGEKEIE